MRAVLLMLCCCACGAGDDTNGIVGECAMAVWQAPRCTLESERGWLLVTTTFRGCFARSDTRLLIEWDGDVTLASATRTRTLGDDVEQVEVSLQPRDRFPLLAEIIESEARFPGDRFSTHQTLSRIDWGCGPDPAVVVQRGYPGFADELVEDWFATRSNVKRSPRRRAVMRSVEAEISAVSVLPP